MLYCGKSKCGKSGCVTVHKDTLFSYHELLKFYNGKCFKLVPVMKQVESYTNANMCLIFILLTPTIDFVQWRCCSVKTKILI